MIIFVRKILNLKKKYLTCYKRINSICNQHGKMYLKTKKFTATSLSKFVFKWPNFEHRFLLYFEFFICCDIHITVHFVQMVCFLF